MHAQRAILRVPDDQAPAAALAQLTRLATLKARLLPSGTMTPEFERAALDEEGPPHAS